MSKRKLTEFRKKYLRFRISERRRKLKLKYIEYKGGACVKCNYNKCPAALTFHHLDPNEKDFGIAENGKIRSFDKIKNELDKCILLCQNCHAETHYEESEKNRQLKLQEINSQKTIFEKSKLVNCNFCNKEVLRFSSSLKNKVFCSVDCKKNFEKNSWITDIELLEIVKVLSPKEIAEKYKKSLSTVYNKIAKLKKLGYITV